MSSNEKALEIVATAEQKMKAEVEGLLKAANIDPKLIMPELEKLAEPKPDAPTGEPKAQPAPPANQGPKSEQEILAELEKAEQQARANLPQLEQQLVDAGVERASIDQLMALLKSPA
jgi:hypothetical protein